jgi:hypothetical protein
MSEDLELIKRNALILVLTKELEKHQLFLKLLYKQMGIKSTICSACKNICIANCSPTFTCKICKSICIICLDCRKQEIVQNYCNCAHCGCVCVHCVPEGFAKNKIAVQSGKEVVCDKCYASYYNLPVYRSKI